MLQHRRTVKTLKWNKPEKDKYYMALYIVKFIKTVSRHWFLGVAGKRKWGVTT